MSNIDRTKYNPIILTFNSKDRISGTNSSFLSDNALIQNYGFDSVCLIQASIPRSFYNVPSGYNTFVLNENGVNKTVTMPVGSYNRINFRTVLQTQINLVSSYVYTITYPNTTIQADTFKYTFSVNNSNPVSFIFTSGLFRQMGFEQNTTYSFVAQTLVSANCINLSYITRAFIKSNICADSTDGILEEILNYGSFPMLSFCFFEQNIFDGNTRALNQDVQGSYLFSLVDSFDQLIDLNNVPWSFSLCFYKRIDTLEIHKQELMLQNEERLFKLEKDKNIIEDIQKKVENNIPISASESTYLQYIKPIYPYNSKPNDVFGEIEEVNIKKEGIKEKKNKKKI